MQLRRCGVAHRRRPDAGVVHQLGFAEQAVAVDDFAGRRKVVATAGQQHAGDLAVGVRTDVESLPRRQAEMLVGIAVEAAAPVTLEIGPGLHLQAVRITAPVVVVMRPQRHIGRREIVFRGALGIVVEIGAEIETAALDAEQTTFHRGRDDLDGEADFPGQAIEHVRRTALDDRPAAGMVEIGERRKIGILDADEQLVCRPDTGGEQNKQAKAGKTHGIDAQVGMAEKNLSAIPPHWLAYLPASQGGTGENRRSSSARKTRTLGTRTRLGV